MLASRLYVNYAKVAYEMKLHQNKKNVKYFKYVVGKYWCSNEEAQVYAP